MDKPGIDLQKREIKTIAAGLGLNWYGSQGREVGAADVLIKYKGGKKIAKEDFKRFCCL